MRHSNKKLITNTMAAPNKTLIVLMSVLATLVVSLLVAQAQKTASDSSYSRQQSSFSSSALGSGPTGVYGGYGAQQQVSPSAGRRPIKQQAPVNRPAPVQQQQQQQPDYYGESSGSSSQEAEASAEPASYGAVSGQPGRDFPAYTQVPKTSFKCEGLPYEYGMYADEETGCQAYHLCYNGRRDSFLCGPGTVFNQRILHCDYWYSVDCGKSSQYYSSNEYMGSSQPEPGPAQAGGASAPQAASQNFRRTEASSIQATALRRPVSPVNQKTNAFSQNHIQQQQQVQEQY